MTSFAAENLGCIRGERTVFSNLSFHLESGDLLLLHGQNGSGKSSLLRVLAGLIDHSAGRLFWNQAALGRDLSVWARLHGRGSAKVTAALAAFDLVPLAQQPGRLLSSGQRRRLALARLLVIPARLWLLDEPTVGLDRSSIARLTNVLTDHRAAGGMVILATHVAIEQPDTRDLNLNDFQASPTNLHQASSEELDAALDRELGW